MAAGKRCQGLSRPLGKWFRTGIEEDRATNQWKIDSTKDAVGEIVPLPPSKSSIGQTPTRRWASAREEYSTESRRGSYARGDLASSQHSHPTLPPPTKGGREIWQ